MQISATFGTPDEAAAAAGAVVRAVPDVLDVKVSDGKFRHQNFYTSLLPSFNTAGSSPTYSAAAVRSERTAPVSGKSTVTVTCSDRDYRSVSHVIVNRGGRNISSCR